MLGQCLNAASTQSRKLSNSSHRCRIQFLSTNHQYSIWFKSGEYGGKYHNSHLASATISSIAWERWKLAKSCAGDTPRAELRALSMMMISPGCNWGRRHSSNHISNKSRLQEPSNVMGANRLLCLSAAIQLTLSVRFPDLRAWKRCPISQ